MKGSATSPRRWRKPKHRLPGQARRTNRRFKSRRSVSMKTKSSPSSMNSSCTLKYRVGKHVKTANMKKKKPDFLKKLNAKRDSSKPKS